MTSNRIREVFFYFMHEINLISLSPLKSNRIFQNAMATKAKPKAAAKKTAAKKKVSAKSAAAKKGWATRRKNAKK